MEKIQWNQLLSITKEWAVEAGDQIKDSFTSSLNISFKSNPSDLVTDIDKQTEEFFVNKIKRHFPEHRILGEEGYGDKITEMSGIVWVIDPIDGTTNFVHMQRNFSISIGVFENGIGKLGLIYDVVGNELFHAIKGEGAFLNDQRLPKLNQVPISEALISMNTAWLLHPFNNDGQTLSRLVKDIRGARSIGSAAIEMAYVTAGRLDGYISLNLSPWDYAAGSILINEVGGKVSTVDGEALNYLNKSSIFVAKPGLFDDVYNEYFRV